MGPRRHGLEVGDARVSPAVVLALIVDLYAQVQALSQENKALHEQLADRTPDA